MYHIQYFTLLHCAVTRKLAEIHVQLEGQTEKKHKTGTTVSTSTTFTARRKFNVFIIFHIYSISLKVNRILALNYSMDQSSLYQVLRKSMGLPQVQMLGDLEIINCLTTQSFDVTAKGVPPAALPTLS